MQGFWLKLFPFLAWRAEVDRGTLRADAIAGLTGALIVMPQGVAFATIAGLPPEYGLYSAMVPTVVAALYGSSYHLVSGPNTAASLVVFSSLSALADPGTGAFIQYALTLTLLVGIIELGLGIARLGMLVNFISHAVIVGFTAGAAILIAVHQLESFLGVDAPRGLHFYEQLFYFAANGSSIDPWTVAVGLATLGAGLYCKRHFPRIPDMLAALLVGSILAAACNAIPGAGPELRVALVGEVPVGLPPFAAPDLSSSSLKELVPVALAVSLFSLTVSVSLARSLATRSGQLVHADQEFIGQGLSNVLGSFFSSYVSTASLNRTALNYASGARTPLAAALSGGAVLIAALGIAPVLAYLPLAGMAAVLFRVAWGLIERRAIARICRSSSAEALVLGVTFLATLLLELEFAILLGVLLSLMMYLRGAAFPRVLVRMPDPRSRNRRLATDASLPQCPQLRIVLIDGPLFFGSVDYVSDRLRILERRNPSQNHLLILARSVSTMDIAGGRLLAEQAALRNKAGGGLYLHQLMGRSLEIAERMGIVDAIGRDHLFESKEVAIGDIFGRLDRSVCAGCESRVFRECASLPGPRRSQLVDLRTRGGGLHHAAPLPWPRIGTSPSCARALDESEERQDAATQSDEGAENGHA